MKKACLLLLLCISLSSYSFSWRDLWFTKDQQGQALMQQKQFEQAGDTFQNQAWRGAAAYRAGDYKKAVNYYESLNNEQGFYNQGNALAKLGQYEKAIKAYDRALALNPNNKDAQYNRKLIEELLKKNKQQPNNQQNKDQQNQGQQGNQQDKNQQNQGQQGNQQDKNQQNQGQQDNQQDKEQKNQEQQGSQQDKNQPNKEPQSKQEKTNKNSAGSESQSIEEREKQQAKEQWLRLIPDDPGGLLREKFLRDHIRRQGDWYQ